MTRRGDASDDPVRLGDALVEVSAGLGLPEPEAVEALRARWGEIVGADVAPHARPGAIRDGVLTVHVDAAPWATRLRYAEGDVVRGATAVVGPGVVRVVRVRVDRPS